MPQAPFDIRNLDRDSSSASPEVQKNYDIINVMVNVFGEIPFGAFYPAPFLEVLQTAEGAFASALELNLFSDATSARDAYERLRQTLGAFGDPFTLASAFATPPEEFPDGVWEAFQGAKEAGFCVPFLEFGPAKREACPAAIENLVREAGDLTLRDLHTVGVHDVSESVRHAIGGARAAGVLQQKKNDKKWNGYECVYAPLDYCLDTGNGCSLASL